jgi:hypothetical protein
MAALAIHALLLRLAFVTCVSGAAAPTTASFTPATPDGSVPEQVALIAPNWIRDKQAHLHGPKPYVYSGRDFRGAEGQHYGVAVAETTRSDTTSIGAAVPDVIVTHSSEIVTGDDATCRRRCTMWLFGFQTAKTSGLQFFPIRFILCTRVHNSSELHEQVI